MKKSVLIGGVAAAAVIAVGSVPVFYNSKINSFIQKEKSVLSQYGLTLNPKTKEDSYFYVKRTYILTLEDVTPLVKKIYPEIRRYDLNSLKEAFDGTKFLVQVNMLKYPVNHKDAVKISLMSLNPQITREMQNDEIGKQILNLIKQKTFEVIMDMDNSGISKVKVKDMNFDIISKEYYGTDIFHVKTKNIYATLNGQNDTYHIDLFKIATTSNRKHNNMTFVLKNYNETMTKKDMFNFKDNSTVGLIKLDIPEGSFALKNMQLSSYLKTSDDKLNTNFSWNIGDFSLVMDEGNIDVKNLHLSFQANNIDANAIKMLQQNLKNSNVIRYSYALDNTFEEAAQQILNKGVNGKISLSFGNIKINANSVTMNFDPTNADLSYDIKPIAQINDINTLLQKINASLHLQTSAHNINTLVQIEPSIGIYAQQFVKINGDKAVTDIKLKNGVLTVNGKLVPLN